MEDFLGCGAKAEDKDKSDAAYTPPDYPQCKTYAAAVSLAQRNTSPEAPSVLVLYQPFLLKPMLSRQLIASSFLSAHFLHFLTSNF